MSRHHLGGVVEKLSYDTARNSAALPPMKHETNCAALPRAPATTQAAVQPKQILVVPEICPKNADTAPLFGGVVASSSTTLLYSCWKNTNAMGTKTNCTVFPPAPAFALAVVRSKPTHGCRDMRKNEATAPFRRCRGFDIFYDAARTVLKLPPVGTKPTALCSRALLTVVQAVIPPTQRRGHTNKLLYCIDRCCRFSMDIVSADVQRRNL